MALQKTQVSIILVVAALVAASTLVSGLLIASQTIQNTGNVKAIGVGVYSDSGCTNAVSSIDWGVLEPGAATDVTIYVKNEGSIAVVLSMTTNNWNPASASSYMTLSWNRENYALSSGSVVSAVLTLSVSSGVSEITDFSFDIIIIGTEST